MVKKKNKVEKAKPKVRPLGFKGRGCPEQRTQAQLKNEKRVKSHNTVTEIASPSDTEQHIAKDSIVRSASKPVKFTLRDAVRASVTDRPSGWEVPKGGLKGGSPVPGLPEEKVGILNLYESVLSCVWLIVYRYSYYHCYLLDGIGTLSQS